MLYGATQEAATEAKAARTFGDNDERRAALRELYARFEEIVNDLRFESESAETKTDRARARYRLQVAQGIRELFILPGVELGGPNPGNLNPLNPLHNPPAAMLPKIDAAILALERAVAVLPEVEYGRGLRHYLGSTMDAFDALR